MEASTYQDLFASCCTRAGRRARQPMRAFVALYLGAEALFAAGVTPSTTSAPPVTRAGPPASATTSRGDPAASVVDDPHRGSDFFPQEWTSSWVDPGEDFAYQLPLRLSAASMVQIYGLVDAEKMMADEIFSNDVSDGTGEPLWTPLTVLEEATRKSYAMVTVSMSDWKHADFGEAASGYLETWYHARVIATENKERVRHVYRVRNISEITGGGEALFKWMQFIPEGVVVHSLTLRGLCGNHAGRQHTKNAERAIAVGRGLFGFPKHEVPAAIGVKFDSYAPPYAPDGVNGSRQYGKPEYAFTADHLGQRELTVIATLETNVAASLSGEIRLIRRDDPGEQDPMQNQLPPAIGSLRDGSSPLQAYHAADMRFKQTVALWNAAAGDRFLLGEDEDQIVPGSEGENGAGFYSGPLSRWDFVPFLKGFSPEFQLVLGRPSRPVWRAGTEN